jgi:LPXTG-site transpeptidase (sortase) family protein
MKNLQTIIEDIMANKFHFLAAFFCIFTLSYGILYALDFYPEPIKSDAVAETKATTTAVEVKNTPTTTPATPVATIDPTDTLPLSLSIDALDRIVKVLNPASNSVEAMDTALLSGVIRHPDSATFGEEGNMLILGHSSYLPTVHNRNFQALNGIQNLKWGDTITLESKNTEYTYKVEKTYKAKATGYTVPIAGKGKTLTLVTCNSFGSTEDRFVVEATLISSKKL